MNAHGSCSRRLKSATVSAVGCPIGIWRATSAQPLATPMASDLPAQTSHQPMSAVSLALQHPQLWPQPPKRSRRLQPAGCDNNHWRMHGSCASKAGATAPGAPGTPGPAAAVSTSGVSSTSGIKRGTCATQCRGLQRRRTASGGLRSPAAAERVAAQVRGILVA